MARLRVAVLAGGRSSEHEISLASARSVLESLDPEHYDVVTVAIGRDGRWALGSGDGSVAETLPVPTGFTARATICAFAHVSLNPIFVPNNVYGVTKYNVGCFARR